LIEIYEDDQFQLSIIKEGFQDVVVWNCWEDGVKSLSDMGQQQWEKYVCVEVATIQNPIQLKNGESWTARQTISQNSQKKL